jgi:hypothetical protein
LPPDLGRTLRPYFPALFAAVAQGQMGQLGTVVFRVLDGELPPGVRLQLGLQVPASGACGVERLAQSAALLRKDKVAMDFSESVSNLTKIISACCRLILRRFSRVGFFVVRLPPLSQEIGGRVLFDEAYAVREGV